MHALAGWMESGLQKGHSGCGRTSLLQACTCRGLGEGPRNSPKPAVQRLLGSEPHTHLPPPRSGQPSLRNALSFKTEGQEPELRLRLPSWLRPLEGPRGKGRAGTSASLLGLE